MKYTVGLCAFVGLFIGGCSWMQSHEGELIDDGVKFGLCITHELLLENHDYSAIAVKCGKQATADVIALITEQDRKVTAALKSEKDEGFKEGAQASVGVCRPAKP